MTRIMHTSEIWLWTTDKAPAAWHFVTIDGAAAQEIEAHSAMRRLETGGGRRGFGAVKVSARIGATRWNTSVFPSKDAGGYLLPVKAAVRKAEAVGQGDRVTVELELI